MIIHLRITHPDKKPAFRDPRLKISGDYDHAAVPWVALFVLMCRGILGIPLCALSVVAYVIWWKNRKAKTLCLPVLWMLLLLPFAAGMAEGAQDVHESSYQSLVATLERCDMKTFAPPVPARLEGYEKAHCVIMNDHERICKALGENADAYIVVLRSNVPEARISARSFLGETEDYEVLKKDLDLDGHDELIIVNHETVSNGMAVEYWKCYIFDGKAGYKSDPLSFQIQDYGKRAFVTQASSGRCMIVATEWSEGKNIQGREGSYFVGRFFEYTSGKLVVQGRYPIAARRYLNSFESDRAAVNSIRWMKRANTEYRTAETIFDAYKHVDDSRGVVKSLELKDGRSGEGPYVFSIAGDNNQTETYTYSSRFADQNPNQAGTINRIGDARSKRYYPLDYVGPDLLNKKVVISHYKDKYGNMHAVLWF